MFINRFTAHLFYSIFRLQQISFFLAWTAIKRSVTIYKLYSVHHLSVSPWQMRQFLTRIYRPTLLKVQFFMIMFHFANKTNCFPPHSILVWFLFESIIFFSVKLINDWLVCGRRALTVLACLAAVLFKLQFTCRSVLYYCCLDAGIGGCDSLKDIILITCFEMHVSVKESALGRGLTS